MEMTTPRLAGLTLGAFALLLAARPPRPTGLPYNERREERASDRATEAERAVRDTLFRVNQAILLREVRDSAARQLRNFPAQKLDALIVDPRIAPSLRRHMQAQYAETRKKLGQRAALPLFVTLDSMTNFGWVSTMWVDDSVAGRPVCATVVRVHARQEIAGDSRVLNRTVVHRLGANFPQPRQFALCSFEASFGPPSPVTRRWLADRNYYSIASGYDPAMPVTRRSPFIETVGGDPRWIPWWSAGGENGEFGIAVRACVFGRAEQCSVAVAAEPVLRYTLGLTAFASDWSYSYWWSWRGLPILMNSLAQSLGPNRFSELWRGQTQPLDAYRALTGAPADTLVRRLLVGEHVPVRLGTAPTVPQALAALLLAALFVSLSLLSHPRRRH